ncbi:hypothetical protein GP2_023_00040 [Gordonia paraffinivorans NBRC 108238]|uniref:Uncharacterized protein n=1 Tax=Gordonia paraffinivorans NBRC 108238 TaxID=1223543 RepID=A0ABQ0ILP2_9ACTN|nr:2-hydroxyacyl-CoA dehydratase [Gordonia paraffinivorans]GAC84481.1 hypothetical protein GP2_023_00040 [Gordonia paraffinivorans NBRC 108238]
MTPRAAVQALLRRLHFYTGILVAPFLIIATVSGGLYAVAPSLEQLVYRDQLHTDQGGTALPLNDQISAAEAARPDLTVAAVQPAVETGQTTRVLFTDPSLGESERLAIFVEPVTGQTLGELTVYGSAGALPLRTTISGLCKAAPTPATYWDWVASIAPINFLPGNQDLVDYFAGVKAEIEQRLVDGVGAVPTEKYRLYFDGIMNWTQLGWLSKRFAEFDAAVVCGRYTHNSFWQEPQLIDVENPLRGMAQHYLICPINHGLKIMQELLVRDLQAFDIDGIAFHSSRTCRAMTNPQQILAKTADRQLGVKSMFFEGDVADASFYKDDVLESRLVAMLETIDMQRARA